jgi:predicted acylesterase/phospholipase RssA/GTPase SAR1 family protein
MNIGLVFEGGGGKGAYQIGAWKAIRELGIEPYVTCVSGTSVGALNAALFYMGNYYFAEEIWCGITDDDILHLKEYDSFENGNCIFSQKKLADLIEMSIKGASKNPTCKECYVTCRYRDKSEHKYFKWSDFYDIELKKRVLLASAAIPIVFESVNIDGEWFVDGGANGDNIPVKPLERKPLDCIIVIHLSDNPAIVHSYKGSVIEVFPSVDLGGFIDGTLDFSSDSIAKRMKQGYLDAKNVLADLADICYSVSCSKGRSGNRKKQKNTKLEKVVVNNMEDEEMVDFKFSNDEVRKQYEDKVASLQKIVDDNSVDNAYLWDATVQKYATKMSKVREILKTEGINDLITSKMFKDIDTFLKKCSEAEFHIALVGAIKAGKSTLINALLGYEYASTKVTPETAALTKFKKGSTNYVKVSFYKKSEWEELWKSANDAKATVFLEEYANLNADKEKDSWLGEEDKRFECDSKEKLVEEIQKWTSSKSVCHYFVKEVEVGLEEFELPEGVVLVDTPGLDDVVEYRSNITRDYIDRANAVLVCVKADALTGPEMGTIYSVFANTRYNPEKVYIIATQIDTLNRPRESWQEQQEEWLKYLKGNGAYASIELAKKNLVPVSAYLYTLLKNYNDLTDDDDKYWDLDSIIRKFRIKNINENYKELLDFTNIRLLNDKIKREIVQNYKKLLIEDIIGSYGLCKDSIGETMTKVKAAQEEIISASQGGIEEIKKKQAEYTAKYQEAEEDKKELEALLKKLKTATSKRADELEKAIKNLA